MITVPGTVRQPLEEPARRALLAVVHGADPEEVGAQVPDLDVLTLDESGGTFVLRLEVDAPDRTAAGEAAVDLTRRAFAEAGYEADAVGVGAPVVTGIDVG
ncbi:hypothetical protein [Streptomyces sp. NRRL B-24484]|uniref:hypothetical protein n=1 Tax=Streptomyces sp. NRRL B-24484 TaxID=1463833 RepID=UPI001331A4CD|nr:hypothetical protein [Streptomyces sp. NRRL B-24484]